MAEALLMFESSEDESDFDGFFMDETVETRPTAAGTSAVLLRDVAGDSDDEGEELLKILLPTLVHDMGWV